MNDYDNCRIFQLPVTDLLYAFTSFLGADGLKLAILTDFWLNTGLTDGSIAALGTTHMILVTYGAKSIISSAIPVKVTQHEHFKMYSTVSEQFGYNYYTSLYMNPRDEIVTLNKNLL